MEPVAEQTRLTNQEKSARRYASLTEIAEQYAKENEEFRNFCWDEKEESFIPTWRRLETWLKRKHEAGAKIQIIVDSGARGDH